MEFEWICGPQVYWATFYSQLQFFGVLIGTLLWGSLSDYLGRKPIALFVLSFGVSMSFASGVFMLFIFKFYYINLIEYLIITFYINSNIFSTKIYL